MGIMDQVINKAASNIPGGGNSVVNAAMALISKTGGIQGLIRLFHDHGMGHMVDSWVSTGPNIKIEEHQLQEVFGKPQLESLAKQSGVPYQDLTSSLSRFLPGFVNEITAHGEIPQNMPASRDLLAMGMRLLGK